jgi:hypothetical protein
MTKPVSHNTSDTDTSVSLNTNEVPKPVSLNTNEHLPLPTILSSPSPPLNVFSETGSIKTSIESIKMNISAGEFSMGEGEEKKAESTAIPKIAANAALSSFKETDEK